MTTAGPSNRIWKQDDTWGKQFALVTDAGQVASLQFDSALGSRATASFGPHSWTFKRSGFWRPKVTIRLSGSELEYATFTPHWMYAGHLVIEQSRHYNWKHTSFFGFSFHWETIDGTELVRLPNRGLVFEKKSEVVISDAGSQLTDLPLFGNFRLVSDGADYARWLALSLIRPPSEFSHPCSGLHRSE